MYLDGLIAHFLDSVNLTRFSKGLLQCSVIQISNTFEQREPEEWPCLNPPWFTFVNVSDNKSVEENLRLIATGHFQHLPNYDTFNEDLIVAVDQADVVSGGVLVGRANQDGTCSLERVAVGGAVGRLVSLARQNA